MYLGEANNGEKSTSNDSDYYYCRGDVGKVVNQPHAECLPLMCLALPVNSSHSCVSPLMVCFLIQRCCPSRGNFSEMVGVDAKMH